MPTVQLREALNQAMTEAEEAAVVPAQEAAARPADQPIWTSWPDEKLLDVRMCDLDLRIEGTELEGHINRLNRDLEEHTIRFRPRFWFSDESSLLTPLI